MHSVCMLILICCFSDRFWFIYSFMICFFYIQCLRMSQQYLRVVWLILCVANLSHWSQSFAARNCKNNLFILDQKGKILIKGGRKIQFATDALTSLYLQNWHLISVLDPQKNISILKSIKLQVQTTNNTI